MYLFKHLTIRDRGTSWNFRPFFYCFRICAARQKRDERSFPLVLLFPSKNEAYQSERLIDMVDSYNMGVKDESTLKTVFAELGSLTAIALPSVLLQFNMYFIYPQAASEVGRRSTEELAGLSLGSLVGNITCLSLMIGVLGAADTLMPRAYGTQRYAEVGRLMVRAILVAMCLILIPVIPLCTVMEPMMDFLGQDPIATSLAAKWIRIYLLGVPANLILRTLQRFLVAQSLPWPPVYATTIPSLVIFPFLVRTCVAHMGFLGSAVAVASTQWLMLLLLLAYLRARPVYKPETWPGLTWSFFVESIRWKKLLEFVNLASGGVMSLTGRLRILSYAHRVSIVILIISVA